MDRSCDDSFLMSNKLKQRDSVVQEVSEENVMWPTGHSKSTTTCIHVTQSQMMLPSTCLSRGSATSLSILLLTQKRAKCQIQNSTRSQSTRQKTGSNHHTLRKSLQNNVDTNTLKLASVETASQCTKKKTQAHLLSRFRASASPDPAKLTALETKLSYTNACKMRRR